MASSAAGAQQEAVQAPETKKRQRTFELAAAPDLYLVASPTQLTPAGVGSAWEELKKLIGAARHRVRITMMMLSGDAYGTSKEWLELENLLKAAASDERRVKVEILVSHWNLAPHPLRATKRLSLVPRISVRYLQIPEHSQGVIPHARVNHSKLMVIDDEILRLGTSNGEKNYFYASRGVELVAKRPPLAQQGN